jgi:hypothetical protein
MTESVWDAADGGGEGELRPGMEERGEFQFKILDLKLRQS